MYLRIVYACLVGLCTTIAPCWWPSSDAAAGEYPSHKVRLIVPFAAGGPTDVIARLVAGRLSEAWGQQVYIENLLGAGGNLGVETAARAAPDGYTMLVVSTGFIVNPSMYTKVRYDPIKDFKPITLVASSPNVVMVTPSVPAKNLLDLVKLVKDNPGKYSYAQPVTGSTAHLAGELLKQRFGLDLVMVPFNGAPLAINSTLGGYTPIAFTALPPAVGSIRDGSLRGLAVFSNARATALPDLPTSGEAGVPEMESDTLTGIVAPEGTPDDIIEKWHATILQMAGDPEIRRRLGELGFNPVADTPAEFEKRLKSEMTKWNDVIKNVGIHLD
jgi:tripartite-type tricarboxylate transporter receptor subunit TctC